MKGPSLEALDLEEILRLRQKSANPLIYETIHLPPRIVPYADFAFGGYINAVAVQAAFHSLKGGIEEKDSWSIYSANGLFLGPTHLEALLEFEVACIRDTRSFATRYIIAKQKVKGKKEVRPCFCVTIDFVRKMPSSGPPHQEARLPLSYSLSPVGDYPHPDKLMMCREFVKHHTERGVYTPAMQKMFDTVWTPFLGLFDVKTIEDSVMTSTLGTVVPYTQTKIKTNQQKANSDVTTRRTADYFRARKEIRTIPLDANTSALEMTTRSIQASALAIVADQLMTTLGLVEHLLSAYDAAASTLDFAIRFHDDDYDFRQYHLREFRTYCAERQRTFNELLIFDLDEKLIASSTQQCSCRVIEKKSDRGPRL